VIHGRRLGALFHFWLWQAQIGAKTGGPATGNQGVEMRGYTAKEKLKITAGAVSAVVIVGWLAILAFALLTAP
jgi:hypothetical protein